MKSSNRQPETVYINRKIGRPAPDIIQTDSFQLRRQDDNLDFNALINTVTNIADKATQVSNAVTKTTASVTQAYNNAVGAVNAGYNNIVQNTNPQVNAGYNPNTTNNAGVSLMPNLQLSANPQTNMLILVGLGILILAVVYSLFLRRK